MKKIIVILTIMLISISGYSQVRPHGHYYGLGLETDIIPFLSGGYHGSLWWGYNYIRVRGIGAKTKIPKFVNPEGFIDNIINLYGLYGDYFFKKKFEGGWLTVGGEYWRGSITNEYELISADYSSIAIGLGAGYCLKFWKNFSINPGIALKIVVAGEKDVEVDNLLFTPNTITPEISLKLGWHIFM